MQPNRTYIDLLKLQFYWHRFSPCNVITTKGGSHYQDNEQWDMAAWAQGLSHRKNTRILATYTHVVRTMHTTPACSLFSSFRISFSFSFSDLSHPCLFQSYLSTTISPKSVFLNLCLYWVNIMAFCLPTASISHLQIVLHQQWQLYTILYF